MPKQPITPVPTVSLVSRAPLGSGAARAATASRASQPSRASRSSRGPRISVVTTVTAFALLALAACGTESKSGAGAGAGEGTEVGARSAGSSVPNGFTFTGVYWDIAGVTVDGKSTVVPDKSDAGLEVTAVKSAEPGTGAKGAKTRISAQGACNHLGAEATVDGDTITIGRTETTQRSCDDALLAFDEALGRVLTGKLRATVGEAGGESGEGRTGESKGEKKEKDGHITLINEDGDTVDLAPVAPTPLTGTTWTVDSLVDGPGTSTSLPAGTAGRATLTFSEVKETEAKESKDPEQGGSTGTGTGTVEGSLGCNAFSGSFTVSEESSTLTFGALRTTRKMCAEPEMAVEQQVLKALNGTAEYELGHNTLTLTATGDKAGGAGVGAVAKAPEEGPAK
ncbi:META domain-containing protein [Streptomyces sp. NPDC088554]|uniref:META domain-containing protein n=1 Tax=Streptomyces sp. NPDC088554 TaxID=3365865 RepID=UPI003813E6F8